MLKRLWLVVSVLWSSFWVFMVFQLTDWNNPRDVETNRMGFYFAAAPWALVVVPFIVRYIVRGDPYRSTPPPVHYYRPPDE